MRYVEKSILLQTLDHLWREHLVMLEHLRQVIGLRGYGQRDPLNEYKSEAFTLFEAMSQSLREAVTGAAHAGRDRAAAAGRAAAASCRYMQAHHVDPSTGEDEMALADGRRRTLAAGRHTGRAARAGSAIRTIRPAGARSAATRTCPCGSGKKYKHCHGRFG